MNLRRRYTWVTALLHIEQADDGHQKKEKKKKEGFRSESSSPGWANSNSNLYKPIRQKPLLWVEVGARAVRKRSEYSGVVWAGAISYPWRATFRGCIMQGGKPQRNRRIVLNIDHITIVIRKGSKDRNKSPQMSECHLTGQPAALLTP
jgi:hypothetical protein